MKEAAGSWRVRTKSIPSRRAASRRSRTSPPGRPNIRRMPASCSVRATTSAQVGIGTGLQCGGRGLSRNPSGHTIPRRFPQAVAMRPLESRTSARAVACATVLGLLASVPAHAQTTPADLLLTNGRVYTLAWDDPAPDGTPAANAPRSGGVFQPDAEAVAVTGDRIVFVGPAAKAAVYRGPRTRVIDVKGATVVPGLVDSHTHVAGLGEAASQIDLTTVSTEEEAVARVAAAAKTTPKGEWILGRGWDEGAWANRYPGMKLLSEAVPDHPVYLASLHGFAGWGNRLAFERAGITRDTPSPEGGEVVKDKDGNPTGILLNRAVPLLSNAVPLPTPERTKAYVLAGLERMARDGYVTIHEAGADRALLRAFQDLDAEGKLPVRVSAMLSVRDDGLCREWLSRGPDKAAARRLEVRSVKAFYDGALGSRGARLLEDYSDRPGHRGVSGNQYGFDQALVAQLVKAGFQVAIHAIGDAGNRETLDFIEAVEREQPRVRHT